jgi:hypothetical protein
VTVKPAAIGYCLALFACHDAHFRLASRSECFTDRFESEPEDCGPPVAGRNGLAKTEPLGFTADHVPTARVSVPVFRDSSDAGRILLYEHLLDRLENVPGINRRRPGIEGAAHSALRIATIHNRSRSSMKLWSRND